ncbi:CLUMA_CG012334, isoform A [Clunio marinus]|uniref:CLUMA_CG012334, isoform A n=1 Tax=Clunio marinus TaxID=568069 RepID=A0A1J1IES3_9DIPT|nr:CLUMA_CG012334, isoform A [Clunio marinus]
MKESFRHSQKLMSLVFKTHFYELQSLFFTSPQLCATCVYDSTGGMRITDKLSSIEARIKKQ